MRRRQMLSPNRAPAPFVTSKWRSAAARHWIIEERPQQAIALIIPFLEEKK